MSRLLAPFFGLWNAKISPGMLPEWLNLTVLQRRMSASA